MSREMADKVIVPKKKNNVPKFLKQRYIGNFMYSSAVVVCKRGGEVLAALLCEEVFRGWGVVGRYPPAPPTSVGINGCMLGGGGGEVGGCYLNKTKTNCV